MCGIAGIVSKKSNPNNSDRLQQAAAALAHRGPESKGCWSNSAQTVTLAHQRLAIIDCTASAAQPLHYQDRYVIIHNGELYNYKEIRQDLQKRGYTFASTSDTEVMVAAYAADGEKCLDSFDGMFAFAIWDQRENKLFAARDRFGEKPFFFFYNGEELLFASEMKALWQAGLAKEVNEAMLYNFLTIGYTANPTDPQETFFKNIYKLPAASTLSFTPNLGEPVIEKYWQLNTEENKAISEAGAVEQLQHLLSQSVARRLRSDVPIGTSLSGGLDSSSIVALCNELATGHYTHRCFTAVFPQFEKDEQAQAAKVAIQYGLQHALVTVTESDLLQQMDQLMYYQEEPVSSASVLAQYKVYEAAKQAGITVLLDGQGADEILAGYSKYYKWHWQSLYQHKQLRKSNELAAASNLGVKETFGWKNKAAALLPQFAAALLQSRKAKAAARLSFLNTDFAFAQKRNLYYSTPATPDLNGALFFNTAVYGLEELLRYADRNSMAHAVEVRLPFMHHPLVEFIFSLPPHFKIRQGWTKWILRKSMEHHLPQDVVWRKDKVGFEPPQKAWMQHKAVQEKIYAGKETLVHNGILAPAALKHYTPADAHAANNYDWRFWSAAYLFGTKF